MQTAQKRLTALTALKEPSRISTRPISAVQLAALRLFIAAYDSAVRNEEVRWGAASARHIASQGIELEAVLGIGASTVGALYRRGLIKLASAEDEQKIDRKGAWGWRLGGTRTHRFTVLFATPTELGRALAAT